MDLNGVRVFVKVVQSGSFSEAARRLQIPKTTVSARVAALESGLGMNLIQRTTRKLHVTEPGKKFFDRCVEAIRLLEAGEAELKLTSNHPQGLLRITAPVDVGQALLPSIVDAFLRAHPDVKVELLITNRMVDVVGEGIDLAIRAGALKDSTFIGRRFFDLHTNIWATPKYLGTLGRLTSVKDLGKVEFVAFGGARAIHLTKGGTTSEFIVNSRVRCDDFETMRAMILLGNCAGLLPDFMALDCAQRGLLAPVLPKWKTKIAGQVQFVYPGLKQGSANVRAFIESAVRTVDPRGRIVVRIPPCSAGTES